MIPWFFEFSKLQYLWIFLAAIALRAIPELLVPSYPVGYETIAWYAPVMMTFRSRGLDSVLQGTFMWGPLFYVLMWFATVATGAHPFVVLKVTGPLLFGGLAASFLLFLRRGLKLESKAAFVGALLMIFQVAALRESWDRFRNVLALIFLFATLTVLRSDHKHKWYAVGILAVLTALSRDYIALVLFATVVGFAVLEKKDHVKSLLALIPAIILLAFIIHPPVLWWNYTTGGTPTFLSETYLGVVVDVLLIFSVCFLPILFFVAKGFRRDKLLDPMLALVLVGSFSAVLIPWFAVPGYQRWLILLVFPFTVYAVQGFERLQLFNGSRVKMLAAVILIFMVLGVGYSTGAFSYVVLPSSWVPPSLVQSSIAWDQIDDVKTILLWLNTNAEANSSVLAEERFYGWTMIYLPRAQEDVAVVAYSAGSPPNEALETALSQGFSEIYLIWYTSASFDNFKVVYSQSSISVFRHESTFVSFWYREDLPF